jgi:hypothetical protein
VQTTPPEKYLDIATTVGPIVIIVDQFRIVPTPGWARTGTSRQ